MKYVLYLPLMISFCACNNASDEQQVVSTDTANHTIADSAAIYVHHFSDTVLEQKITKALLALPFVIKSNQFIDSFSNHRHGIAFILDNPGEHETDISVQAGYNGNERFETYYRFFVNPKTLEIKVYDPVENEKLTVNAWLKRQPK